ncbi:caspase family protein [Streptomyces tuirus]|uniref:Caspase family protein n=1 Tax=Streptomyces tuirus TaxID=68278 RepID=A0A941J2V9_9ACTN|nr:caspase family protein [Streptomyces tuirus]
MTLPDPAQSRAVLIGNTSGVKNMPDLKDIPAVEANVLDLRQALTDGSVWSLPPENCVTILQPKSSEVVKRAVRDAAAAAADTLLVYYAGHGLRAGSDHSLYLTLPHTEDPDEGVRYNDLALRLKPPTRKGLRTLVVLDCCYAELAADGMGTADDEEFARETEIKGVGLLTAAARTRKALAPAGERHTAFTSELLAVLREGDPQGPAFLDLDDVFNAVSRRLDERRRTLRHLPEPRLKCEQLGSRIILTRNSSYREPPPPPVQTDRPPHTGSRVRDYLRRQSKVADLYVLPDGASSWRVWRASKVHSLKAGEEIIALWIWSPWAEPSSNLVLTSTGLRIRDSGTQVYIPYEEFQRYKFDSDYLPDVSAYGDFDPKWWLTIEGPQSWTSKQLGHSAPEKMAERLQSVQRMVT